MAGAAGTTGSSPLADYLAAAGVDPAMLATDAAGLPPTEVLLDAAHAADVGVVQKEGAIDDAALAAMPAEVPQQPEDGTQHHGV